MEKESRMKKDETEQLTVIETEMDEMRSEYDLSKLKGRTRGKYVERYQAETNLASECSKLDKSVEQSMADEGLSSEVTEWLEY